ncbi:MAG: hypothetical protein V1847_01875, partial [Candidatus Diapherotrites archaeon]
MDQTFDPNDLARRWECEQARIETLPEPNRTLILDFLHAYRFKKKALSTIRKNRLAGQLYFFATLSTHPLKPFKDLEAKELVQTIERFDGQRPKPYSLFTWKEMTKNIKIWIKWSNPEDYPSIIHKCQDCLTVQNPYTDPKRKARLDEFLITEET